MADEYEGLLARNYDALYGVMRDPSGDAAFYRALAQETGGPVLELGCGTGRVLLPIAALGIPCVGVDASPAMLAALRGEEPATEPGAGAGTHGDLRPRRASLPAGDVPVPRLPAPAGRRTRSSRRWRTSAGTWRPAARSRSTCSIRSWRGSRRPPTASGWTPTFTLDGVQTRRFAQTRTDQASADHGGHVPLRAASEVRGNTTVRLRWFYRYEIEHLLARAGFTDLTIYGGYDRRPWRPEGETVIVARAP